VRVLYVSHTSIVGGGERSLLDLFDALPDEVDPVLASPPGDLSAAASARGLSWYAIPGGGVSARLSLRHSPPAVARLAASALAVRLARRRIAPGIVHANSIRAGLIAAAGGPGRLVVHVRDVLPPGIAGATAGAIVRRSAAVILGNSAYTATRFGGNARVVRPWVDVDRFDPARIGRTEARHRLGFPADSPLLGVVGQVTPWKGQIDAIEVLAAVRREFPSARLLLCGSVRFEHGTRYDNRAYERALHERVRSLGLSVAVHFIGERADVEVVMRALDVLLVPSWVEPFGRVVIEGMASGLPVIATSLGGPAELIDDGRTGLLLAPRVPEVWGRSVAALLADRERMVAMGEAARIRACAFTRAAGVEAVMQTYRELAVAAPRSTAFGARNSA